ncbi:MAG: DUF2497 domain-containing protein [Pseudomonadota bacterium]|nr:DUF2497 domain-containing protein [Pseudomonadota bacterium]
MADSNAQKEPTMEEILASIRRIISEDDEPASTAQPPVADDPMPLDDLIGDDLEISEYVEPEPEPEPEYAPEPEPEPEPQMAEVVELTHMLRDDGSIEDLNDFEDEPVQPAPQPFAGSRYEGLLSEPVAASAAASLAGLAGALSAQRDIAVPTHRTLEDITKELLRPMLKDWLDRNLPAIVQRIVEREIAKLAGQVDDAKR